MHSILYIRVMTIAERLDAAMTAARIKSQSALSRASGVPQPTINRILKDVHKHSPDTKTLQALAQSLGVSFEWLAEGRGDMRRAGFNDVATPPEDEFDLVPQLDLGAACGDGKFADHVVVKGGLAFKKTFMKQFGISEATGRVIYAQGSSMEPTIGNGRVVLINLSDTQPQDGRVFLICDQDGAMILKRLIREYEPSLQDTVWKTRSDNPDKRSFPDKILPDDPRVKIVGRAIWHDGLL